MASAPAEPVAVTISLGTTVVESFLGLGVQWDPFYYRPSDEDWQTIVRRMDYCSPGFLRVMWGAGSYCHGFDAAGQPRYAWDETDPAKRAGLDDLCRILEWAQSRDVEVVLGEWGPPYGEIGGPTDLRWARVIADSVAYLREARGFTCIRMYNLINEPNGDWSGNKDYGTWLTGVRNLRSELDARGMAWTVRIIGPDTTGNTEWTEPFDWLDWAARDASDVIGAWDLHWYAMDKEVLGGAIERTLREKREGALRTHPGAAGKPVFLGESGLIDGRCNIDQQPRVRSFEYGVMMADYVAQVARAGWMGATAWDLDDAMHPCKGDPPANPPDDLTLKVWGFWNSQADRMGRPEDKAMRPWFTTWALMSRLFPRGTRILGTDTQGAERFRAVAGAIRRVDADRLTVMLVNNDETPRTVTVRVPGAPVAPAVTEYRFYEDDRPVDEEGFPRPADVLRDVDFAQGHTVEMPSRGVVFLTTLDR
jgi:hypothetical protein